MLLDRVVQKLFELIYERSWEKLRDGGLRLNRRNKARKKGNRDFKNCTLKKNCSFKTQAWLFTLFSSETEPW